MGGYFIAVSLFNGARAKFGSKIFPFDNRSLMAAINSLGLSSFVRAMAASTKVCGWL